MTMPGFRFHETMFGTLHLDGEERPIRFTLDARVPSLLQFLGDRRATIEGHVEAGGIARRAPLVGTMTIDPLLGRLIRYEFGFTGDDGKAYRFAGQKDVTPLHPLRSMTTLPAELTDGAGNKLGSADLMFDLRDLPSFLGSFRPLR